MKASDFFNEIEWESVENDRELSIKSGYLQQSKDKNLKLITVLLDDQGHESASIATTKALFLYSPKLVVSVGISGRISDDCHLGDVVLANLSDNALYRAKARQDGNDTGGKEWSSEALSRPLYRELQKIRPEYALPTLKESELSQLRESRLIGAKVTVHHGPVISSQMLVDDPNWSDWVKKCRNRNILAADMESAAVLQAAHSNGVRDGNVLVVRGISDAANGKKKQTDSIGRGEIRRVAMNNATLLIKVALEQIINFDSAELKIPNKAEYEICNRDSQLLTILNSIDSNTEINKFYSHITDRIKSQRNLRGSIIDLASKSYSDYILNKNIDLNIKPLANDFLIAFHIMKCLRSNSDTESKIVLLSSVYPSRINQFCKRFLIDPEHEKKYVNNLITIYESRVSRRLKNKHERAKSNICYFLGRVKSIQQKSRAKEKLKIWKNKLHKGGALNECKQINDIYPHLQSNSQKLILRTMCISLIILGDELESDEYIAACLNNNWFDALNRGFHLEYYGDIDYDPTEVMTHIDPVTVPIEKTFNTLHKTLLNSYSKNAPFPLRDIELQTLVSLCQQRLAYNILDTNDRKRVIDILRCQPLSRLTRNRNLQNYCRMMLEHFTDEKFSCSNIIKDIYKLKKLPRTGWNDSGKAKRTTPQPETVLSHTAGGMILIEFLLPDKLSEKDKEEIGRERAKDYNKAIISKMFLLHDLAEAYVGDLTPLQKNDFTREKEAEFASHLNLSSTYSSLQNVDFFNLWEDFENNITINGTIAKEIDRLDNLMQLEIEVKNNGVEIEDYEEWKDWILMRIETPVGKRVADFILGEFF